MRKTRKRDKSPSRFPLQQPHRAVSVPFSRFPFALALALAYLGSWFIPSDVDGAPNVPFQLSGWVDFALARLETNGVIVGLHRHTRPWTRWQVAQLVRQADERIAQGAVQLTSIDRQLFEKLKREFASEISALAGSAETSEFRLRAAPQLRTHFNTAQVRPAYEGAFSYTFGRQLTLYQEFEIEEAAEKYPTHGRTAEQRLEPWRGDYAADFKRVYVRFPISRFEVLIGRDQLFWGTGFRSAVGISDNSPPFDLILLTGQFGAIKGTAFTAQLDRMWHDQDGPARRYLADRYLAGHRLDWRVNDRIELGVSEMIVYGGDGRGLEWEYVNPILPYYASQFNAKRDDNVMFLLEGAIRPIDGLRVYTEWLLDDFQYVDSDDPNAVAWLGGVEWNPRRFSLRGEYARVNRWAYTHLVQENQHTHFGSSIGHRIGTDADVLYLEAGYLVNADLRAALHYELERQGEATVEDRYRGEDFEAIPFPSGTVERHHRLGFQIAYEPRSAWQLNFTYQHVFTRNQNHQPDLHRDTDEVAFRLRYLWEARF